MIISFKCKNTEALFNDGESNAFSDIVQTKALSRLIRIHFSQTVANIFTYFPYPEFKQLTNDFHKYQLKVNRQYRIRFNVIDETVIPIELIDVKLADFH